VIKPMDDAEHYKILQDQLDRRFGDQRTDSDRRFADNHAEMDRGFTDSDRKINHIENLNQDR